MQRPTPTDDSSPQPFLQRLNRAIGEINAFLVAIAIGLATLDFTCFVLLRVINEMMRQPLTGG